MIAHKLLAADLRFLCKGLLTRIPALDTRRRLRAETRGSADARYCYSVWLRHRALAACCGMTGPPAELLEMGPGDSLGLGLMALLTGTKRYTGLDAVKFNDWERSRQILESVVEMLRQASPIPGDDEFPRVAPKLDDYAFPAELLDSELLRRTLAQGHVDALRNELNDSAPGDAIRYVSPWESSVDLPDDHFDMVVSQAVMEHVDRVEETYALMFRVLKPGGLSPHVIDMTAHTTSPFWNGHWRYSDGIWALGRGRREFLINRRPLSYHLDCVRRVGFEIAQCVRSISYNGLPRNRLARKFRTLSDEDMTTRGVCLVLRKPR